MRGLSRADQLADRSGEIWAAEGRDLWPQLARAPFRFCAFAPLALLAPLAPRRRCRPRHLAWCADIVAIRTILPLQHLTFSCANPPGPAAGIDQTIPRNPSSCRRCRLFERRRNRFRSCDTAHGLPFALETGEPSRLRTGRIAIVRACPARTKSTTNAPTKKPRRFRRGKVKVDTRWLLETPIGNAACVRADTGSGRSRTARAGAAIC